MPLIFRKGLDRKREVAQVLAESYHSDLVARVKQDGFRYHSGRLTIHIAKEFGFCYGVDRAVDYAYQARSRFPDRTVYLTGEIIHNPHVNDQLRAMGVRFLSDTKGAIDTLTSDDDFYGQVELAFGSAAPAALRPLDVLTPRVTDVRE